MKFKGAWMTLSLVFIGCSAQHDAYQTDASLAVPSDAAESAPVEEINANSDVFAGLETADNSVYYDAVGGESARRVAFALYGKKDAGLLSQKNPQLQASEKLSSGEKVFFDFASAHPQAQYLTKGILERYTGQLSQEFSERAGGVEKTAVAKGETLQSVSQRLYGTTRFWTELYILNKGSLTGFDRVREGQTLSYRVPEHPVEASAEVVAPPVQAPPPAIATETKRRPPAAPPTVEEAAEESIIIDVPAQEKAVVASAPPVIPTVAPAPNFAKPKPAVAAASSAAPKIAEASAPLWRQSIYTGIALLLLVGAFAGAKVIRKKSKKPMSPIMSAIGKGGPRLGVPIPEAKEKKTGTNKAG